MRTHKNVAFWRQRSFEKILLISLMVIIGFLYGLPHLLWLNDCQWDYKNTIFVTSLQPVDAYHYLGKIQEIYEGHYTLSNTYLAEYKGGQKSPWPLLPLYLTAAIGKILHLEVQHLAVVMDFIFPPIIFLLAYKLLRMLNGRYKASLLGSLILTLTPHLLKSDAFLSIFFNMIRQGLTSPVLTPAFCENCFPRPVNPQLTFLFLLASLLFFAQGLLISRKYLIVSIVFGIITSYSYVFFSTYFYTFLGISACLFGIFRKREYFRDSCGVLIITLIGASPFWYSVFHLPEDKMKEMQMKIANHLPVLSLQVLFSSVICLILLVCLIKKYVNRTTGVFSLSMLLSGIICLNQHVISGLYVEPWHYDVFVVPQTTILALFIFGANIVDIRLIPEKRFSGSILMLSGGLLALAGSFLVHPLVIAAILSSDGVLTPEFTTFLTVVHTWTFWGGIGGIFLAGLLKTRLNISLIRSWKFFSSHLVRKLRQLFKWGHLRIVFYAIFLLGFFLEIGFVRYDNYEKSIRPRFGYLQNYSSALKWLQEHTSEESVVLGSTNYSSTSGIIPIYTHNNVYIDQYAQYYFVPSMDELLDRFYNLMFLAGVKSLEDYKQFLAHETSNRIFAGKFSPHFEVYQKKLENDVYEELKKYCVDYLFYGPDERKSFNVHPEMYSFLQKVYHDEHVTIYQIL